MLHMYTESVGQVCQLGCCGCSPTWPINVDCIFVVTVMLSLLKMASVLKVADLDALMNRTRRRRTHERQHQSEVMARASRRNEDRAAILLYNNPLPQLSYSSADDNTAPARKPTTVSLLHGLTPRWICVRFNRNSYKYYRMKWKEMHEILKCFIVKLCIDGDVRLTQR